MFPYFSILLFSLLFGAIAHAISELVWSGLFLAEGRKGSLDVPGFVIPELRLGVARLDDCWEAGLMADKYLVWSSFSQSLVSKSWFRFLSSTRLVSSSVTWHDTQINDDAVFQTINKIPSSFAGWTGLLSTPCLTLSPQIELWNKFNLKYLYINKSCIFVDRLFGRKNCRL